MTGTTVAIRAEAIARPAPARASGTVGAIVATITRHRREG
jgi:hypothetical protein